MLYCGSVSILVMLISGFISVDFSLTIQLVMLLTRITNKNVCKRSTTNSSEYTAKQINHSKTANQIQRAIRKEKKQKTPYQQVQSAQQQTLLAEIQHAAEDPLHSTEIEIPKRQENSCIVSKGKINM